MQIAHGVGSYQFPQIHEPVSVDNIAEKGFTFVGHSSRLKNNNKLFISINCIPKHLLKQNRTDEKLTFSLIFIYYSFF
jgi:hypothetical protein